MEFVDADYIPSAGGTGRIKEDNPYTDVIAGIALKRVITVEGERIVLSPGDASYNDGKPLSKGIYLTYTDEDSRKKVAAKAKRQLAEAGHKNAPNVSVPSRVTPAKDAKGKLIANTDLLVFWTVPQIERKRKADDK